MIPLGTKINFDISIEDCFLNLKPHPKFVKCSFENYIPDRDYLSQLEIKDLLINKIANLNSPIKETKRSFFSFFQKKEEPKILKNIYIDGGYGVGKTHLLSAFYNEANCSKAFLSFSEMNYFFNYLGIDECVSRFSELRLLLIDEFELDDPATTRLIARLFEEIGKNTLILTTSNTLPSDLGKLRFQTESFAKEIGIIANTFKTFVVEGEDYRIRNQIWKEKISDGNFIDYFNQYDKHQKGKIMFPYSELMTHLEDNHPFRYFVISESFDAIFIDGIEPFPLLNSALRFTHLIDQCYYYNTQIFIRSKYGYNQLFSNEMLESCFQKKLMRCLSRLNELSIFFKN